MERVDSTEEDIREVRHVAFFFDCRKNPDLNVTLYIGTRRTPRRFRSGEGRLGTPEGGSTTNGRRKGEKD